MSVTKTTRFDFYGLALELLKQLLKVAISAAALFTLVSPDELKSLDGRLMILGVALVIVWVKE